MLYRRPPLGCGIQTEPSPGSEPPLTDRQTQVNGLSAEFQASSNPIWDCVSSSMDGEGRQGSGCVSMIRREKDSSSLLIIGRLSWTMAWVMRPIFWLLREWATWGCETSSRGMPQRVAAPASRKLSSAPESRRADVLLLPPLQSSITGRQVRLLVEDSIRIMPTRAPRSFTGHLDAKCPAPLEYRQARSRIRLSHSSMESLDQSTIIGSAPVPESLLGGSRTGCGEILGPLCVTLGGERGLEWWRRSSSRESIQIAREMSWSRSLGSFQVSSSSLTPSGRSLRKESNRARSSQPLLVASLELYGIVREEASTLMKPQDFPTSVPSGTGQTPAASLAWISTGLGARQTSTPGNSSPLPCLSRWVMMYANLEFSVGN